MSNDHIAQRAYELYCERGREDGHDLGDWLQAEQEVGTTERPATIEVPPMSVRREEAGASGVLQSGQPSQARQGAPHAGA
jgi:hypothetical protein